MDDQLTVQEIKKIFFSYVGDVKFFVDQFANHFFTGGGELKREDWLIESIPAGASLSAELKKKIDAADVFVAFVDETYRNKIAADELMMALEKRHETGNRRPLLIPIILGVDGLNWWEAISKLFDSDELSDVVREGFFNKGTNDLRELGFLEIKNIQRIRKWILEKLLPPVIPIQTNQPEQSKPGSDIANGSESQLTQQRRVVLFGRPKGAYPVEVSAARNDLAAALGNDWAFGQIADGWHEAEERAAAEMATAVAHAGLDSLLVQACDSTLYYDYGPLGNPPKPGRAFGNALSERGVADDDIPAVIKRTLFWIPRIDTELAKLRKKELEPTDATSADLSAGGPWYGTAAPEELADWIRPLLSGGITFVKAQAGLREVGAKFTVSLKEFLRHRVFVEQVDGSVLAVKVKGAVASGIPIIVVIHDVNISEDLISGQTVESRLQKHVEDFDAKIEAALRGIDAAKVARALLLVRYAHEFEGSKQWDFGNGSWVPVPLARDRNYQPPDDQLELLRAQLGAGGPL
jgi:hypothetical protein